MVALHATRELAKSLKLPANLSVDRAGGTSQLGPWSLGLVNCHGGKLVIAVSSTTRWALAVAAAPFASLLPRFGDALLQNLVALGVPPDRARAEADAHALLQWAVGHDRGTLAHLSQCTRDALWAVNSGLSLPSLNQRLAERIVIKPATGYPAVAVLTRLGGDPDRVGRDKHEQGKNWRGDWEAMQAQAGQASVTLQVAKILQTEQLEADYQAVILLSHLPLENSAFHSQKSVLDARGNVIAPKRWIPHELVLDLKGIDSIGLKFAKALRQQCSQLGVARLAVANGDDGLLNSLSC